MCFLHELEEIRKSAICSRVIPVMKMLSVKPIEPVASLTTPQLLADSFGTIDTPSKESLALLLRDSTVSSPDPTLDKVVPSVTHPFCPFHSDTSVGNDGVGSL
jgi:hypothetical protein